MSNKKLSQFPGAASITSTDLIYMSQNGIEVAATPAQLAAGIAQNAAREVFNAGTNFTAGTTTSLTLAGTYGSINNILVLCDATVQTDCTLIGQTLTFNPMVPLGTQQVVVLGWPSRSIGVPANASVGDLQLAWGNTLSRVCGSIAALQALDPTIYTRAFATGYYQPGDGGGGPYVYSQSSTAIVNGGTVLASATGVGRWLLNTSAPVSIKQFGAKVNGIADDTAAWSAAIPVVMDLYHPGGTSLCSPIAFSNLNGTSIRGAGLNTSIVKLTSAGACWTFNDSQNMLIEQIGFQPASGLTGTTGVVFKTVAGGAGNSIVQRCQFNAFDTYGLACIGTSSHGLSGMKVLDNVFLSNLQKQLYFTWSQDFWIEGNQYGILSGYGHPQFGCFLDNSNAGTYTRNYHWNNSIGFQAQYSNYNRIEMNRFEESDTYGVWLYTCSKVVFTGNTLHTNSESSYGAYDNAYFGVLTDSIVDDNSSFDWNGGSTGHRYGFNFGPGCANLEVKNNKATNWVTGPYGFDSSLVSTDLNTDESIRGATNGTVPSSTAIYVGQGGTNAQFSAVAVPLSRKSSLMQIQVGADANPGSGQTYTYELYKNGASVQTVTLGGTNVQSITVGANVLFSAGDSCALKVTTSSGAAAANHRFSLSLADY
ncbi:NosD domain-containing protein [Burkholderia multivorans]|uniref:NosD domain-containing protein n=2 Tax=Burkholderia multivorans TaxID=87883 RepID=UPI0021BDF641|nr:NosD domain-containing protein [Burkholderia multivorans]MDR9052048.1 hypothetical protein [Burkholderia multivorans]MDR9060120.1 hypothetical protein [Burkholderia multivorans]MDR9062425.1 hypothetical protein [Burkholderia multivorans]MDR9070376.1 hypothetical protein [Burkholderia multivorans]MDR9076552.1 hypothetical protein [Burkholderia multivorans]